jgi:ribosome-associated toxin RatA of RatAB toxin-antitoxin module
VAQDRRNATGGGACLRRSFVVAGLFLAASMTVPAASSQPVPVTVPVTVEADRGVYRVAATFATPQPMAVAHAVLTDYERIPRFMPDVRSSRVIERGIDRAVVEQEAVARVLLFSKQVRLVLEVQEAPASIRFRDRSGLSFIRYEGQWTLREQDGHAVIRYELLAQPAFDVPEFILSRLLKRDAGRMIDALRSEIAARDAGQARPATP